MLVLVAPLAALLEDQLSWAGASHDKAGLAQMQLAWNPRIEEAGMTLSVTPNLFTAGCQRLIAGWPPTLIGLQFVMNRVHICMGHLE